MERQSANIFFENLWIVLVIYKMKIEESSAYQSLTSAIESCNQSTSLFIYDNSPGPQECPGNTVWKTEYHHDDSNLGVSKAYNEGFKKAATKNKKWMLLADQDTVFKTDVFEKYVAVIAQNPQQKIVVPIVRSESMIISPFRFSWGRGSTIAMITPGLYSLRDLKFINSGLLISTHLFEQCDGYDESFPLDFSDLAFIERIKGVHNEFFVMDSVCDHSLSANEKSFAIVKDRFVCFVKASRLYGKMHGSALLLLLTRFFRAIKLGLRFRSLVFFRILFQ